MLIRSVPQLRLSRGFSAVLVALLSGAAAYGVALLWRPAAMAGGHYVPMGQDSFYHARRILDTIADPSAFYQFDPKIHAPEGSWLTWPWAYDRLLAWVVALLQHLTGAPDPMPLLVYVPPTWVFLNAALLIGIGVTLGLRLPVLLLLGVCFALSPLTQILHAVGMLDHHYVEYTFVLLTLWLGLRWLQLPGAAGRAVALGAALGMAPAFHNGLFVLQVPVAAALFLLWLRHRLPDARSAAGFCAALVAGTLLALAPSEPFQQGQFAFYTLSWFHLYVALLTSLGVLLMSRWRASIGSVLALAGIGGAAIVPALSDVIQGGRFLGAQLTELNEMLETVSLREHLAQYGRRAVITKYSGFIVLLPVTVLAAAGLLLRRSLSGAGIYFCVFSIFGAVLLCFQFRLHYFGSFALYLPPLLVLQRTMDRASGIRPGLLWAGAALAVALAYVRPVQYLPGRPHLALDRDYELTHEIFGPLHDACAEHPGVILAGHNDGHYLRYHTDCSVIADNFIMTPQHEDKLRETQRLLSLRSRDIVEHYPWIAYIYVRRTAGVPLTPDTAARYGLVGELLAGSAEHRPGLELIAEVVGTTPAGESFPIARAYRVVRQAQRR